MSCRVSAVVVFMVGFCVADVEGREKAGICWPSYGDRGSLRIDSGDREGAVVIYDEHVKGVLLTELVFVHRDPVLDGGVREQGKNSRDLVLRIRSVLGKEVLCVFLPFDEDRRSDFAWSQCGRDFVRGVRCDDCDFKEHGIRDASHKTWCVVNVVYVFVAVRGSAWKLAYESETRVYACKR